MTSLLTQRPHTALYVMQWCRLCQYTLPLSPLLVAWLGGCSAQPAIGVHHATPPSRLPAAVELEVSQKHEALTRPCRQSATDLTVCMWLGCEIGLPHCQEESPVRQNGVRAFARRSVRAMWADIEPTPSSCSIPSPMLGVQCQWCPRNKITGLSAKQCSCQP